MENERVLYAHEGPGAGQGFRLVVTGEVDKGLMDVLEAFVTFQQKVVGTAKAAKCHAAAETFALAVRRAGQ